jgi:hydrogenase expression/formation protein HypC
MCIAVPGQIKSITGGDPMELRGVVDFGGVEREIMLSFAPEAKIGDWVLVHAGFAITIIDEDSARQTLADFDRILGEADVNGEPH